MRSGRRAAKVLAFAIFIIVILVATPEAQQPVAFSGSPNAMVGGPPPTVADATDIDLLVGRSTILNVGAPIARVSLTVPEVADAMVTAPQQLLIHGKTPGTISLFVWDRAGGIKTYEVNVRRDLKQLIEQMTHLFPGEPISVVGSGKDVILSGTVTSKYVIDKAVDVAAGYVDKKENVVNLLKQQEGIASNQVMLRVRFAEVSRSALQELGVNLFTGPNGFRDYIAQSSTQQFSQINYDELTRSSIQGPEHWGGGRDTVDATGGKFTFSDLLNLMVFNNRYSVGALIKALQAKGLFQSLAEPNLIALNGKEASFLAGGEYPYPVSQPSSGGNSVTIQFKEFGIRLSFTPTVLNGDLINLKVRPEVSSLDFGNGLSIGGFRVPALSTRRTETEVELQDGQTFAIAGLMNNTVATTMSKIPGIGDIPVLGYLFKSRSYSKSQTELVVMITPQIVRRGSTGVSSGLPTITEPYLAAPSKAMPQPAPYVGSPRYPANPGGAPAPRGGSEPQPQAPAAQAPSAPAASGPYQAVPPSRPVQQPTPAASAPAPRVNTAPPPAAPPAAQPSAAQRPPAAAPQSSAPMPSAPAVAPSTQAPPAPVQEAPKPDPRAAAREREDARKAAEAQKIADKRASEEKAAADKRAAEAAAEAGRRRLDEKERQDKLDKERAKREAEVAKKNAEAERKKNDDQKKKDKAMTDAAERLKQAQAAYDRVKGY